MRSTPCPQITLIEADCRQDDEAALVPVQNYSEQEIAEALAYGSLTVDQAGSDLADPYTVSW